MIGINLSSVFQLVTINSF